MIFDVYQKKVIEARNGHFLVLAPPGCGKTELLSYRLLKAHEEGVAYDDMLCLTFTNRAARGMRERIAQAAGDDNGCEGLFVGNIHRFCSRLLFENHLIPSSTGIIDELDQRDILDEFGFTKYNDNCRFRNDRLSVADITRLSSLFYQEEAGHPSEVRLQEPVIQNPAARSKAIDMARRYHEFKKEHAVMDFDDILLLSYEALSKRAPGELVYSLYHWIQVDEVQDLNPIQLAIVDMVTAAEGATVMYLGDEQQAIYSFMGAKMATLRHLKERVGDAGVLRLFVNYRAPKYLVDIYNDYAVKELQMDPSLLPQASNDTEPPKGSLNIYRYATAEKMEADFADRILSARKNFPGESIAVLTRTNAQADKVSARLSEKGQEHFRLSGKDIFHTEEMKALMAHFNVVKQDSCFFDWARILWMTRCTSSFTDARKMVSALKAAAVSPVDLFTREYGHSYVSGFLQTYREKELVIFDTEATGLDVENDDIIQIAAIKVRGGSLVKDSEFNVIIKTERPVPERLGNEHNPMVEVYADAVSAGTALDPVDALRRFLEYVGDDAVLGHNVMFDYRILKYNLLRYLNGFEIERRIISVWDSLRLIRLLKPNLRVYKLRALLESQGLEGTNSHKADDDILATKSLVDYCASLTSEILPAQDALFANVNTKNLALNLQKNYRPIYMHTFGLLDKKPVVSTDIQDTEETGFVREFRSVNEIFMRLAPTWRIEGFDYVVEFLNRSVFRGEQAISLRDQIERHLSDLHTFSQADLCDSGVIREKVFVMTVHKAKGLEFDHIIIYNAVGGDYPFFLATNPIEQMEEARVFYVGLSRSKKRITLMVPDMFMGYSKTLTPFMNNIKSEFKEYVITISD